MINKLMLNKKAQYYQKPSYSSVHPILIIGIILFCVPFLLPIMKIHPVSWVKSIFKILGIIGILFGSLMSIYNASN